MVTRSSLNSNDESPTVNQSGYKSMIWSLLYLIGIRPDTMHVIRIVGRFQANPKESHLHTVKRIFRYPQGTQDFGLWYPNDIISLFIHIHMWIGLEMLMNENH